jgi:hypothetical protein
MKNKIDTSKLILFPIHLNMLEKMNKKEKIKHYNYIINNKTYVLMDNSVGKVVVGEDYNYTFNKTNGDFKRWGKTYEEDPKFSPIGPEILDIEITTICNGINGKLCRECYKSNTPKGHNMSFDTFKDVLDGFMWIVGVQLDLENDKKITLSPETMVKCKDNIKKAKELTGNDEIEGIIIQSELISLDKYLQGDCDEYKIY